MEAHAWLPPHDCDFIEVMDDFIRNMQRCRICLAVRAKNWLTHDVIVHDAGTIGGVGIISVEAVARPEPLEMVERDGRFMVRVKQ